MGPTGATRSSSEAAKPMGGHLRAWGDALKCLGIFTVPPRVSRMQNVLDPFGRRDPICWPRAVRYTDVPAAIEATKPFRPIS